MNSPCRKQWCWCALAVASLAAFSMGQDGQGAFHTSGRISPQWREVHASNVTNDGVVIGTLLTAGRPVYEAFRWNPQEGFTMLGSLASPSKSVTFQGTPDGRFIVGHDSSTGSTVPVYWRDWQGPFLVLEGQFEVPVDAVGVSLDGETITGTIYWSASVYEGYVLSKQHGLETIGHVPGSNRSFGDRLSWDGEVMLTAIMAPWGQEGARWTRKTGLEALGDLPGGAIFSNLGRCSRDGRVGVGRATPTFDTPSAARWTEGSGWQDLGGAGAGFGISGDGWVAVGVSGNDAMVWNPIDGMRLVKDVIEQDFGINLIGWRLRIALAISDNGRYIAGWGFNPGGTLDDIELWMAEIPPFCYADCDRSTSNGPDKPPVLDIFDFLCFGNKFNQRDPYANCNNDAHFDIFDFLCFQDAFAEGCWK